MTELTIVVIGHPAPQGSHVCIGVRNGRHQVVDASKNLKPWRRLVVKSATETIADLEAATGTEWIPIAGPVRCEYVFLLAPPMTMPRDRIAPTVRPDLSKLIRAVEDGLTDAHVYVDDALVTQIRSEKVYADPGGPTGVRVKVTALANQLALI